MTKKKTINSKQALRERILKLMREHRRKSLALPQILDGLQMQPQDKSIVLAEIKQMQEEGLLVKASGGRYGTPARLGYLTGTLEGNRRGFAFLRLDGEGEDVYISAGNLGDAAHGDRVVVRLERKRSRRRREGVVVGVIKRGRSSLVGVLQREGKKHHVVPDDRRFPGVVQVVQKGQKKAQTGDKVVVEIEQWGQPDRPSRGRIVEHFGAQGSVSAERLAFKHRFALPGEHPPRVLKELESLPGEDEMVRLAEEPGRADLRSLKMVTIDDELARDFDDAVSIEKLPGGAYRLGVHIADVSHYVRRGKPLDREALKRGTSIYLVDRVIHMLPPKLSENLCSLQAGRDRLAVSAIMDIDAQGELISYRLTPSLICVTERLSYRQVEAHLPQSGESRSKLPPLKDPSLPEMIDTMAALAAVLRRRRLERGALDLDLPEAQITVDEEGTPLSVEKRIMGLSESLIEEFMIYCNETVASHLAGKKLPCIYRVHTVPTEEKLAVLRETLALMGVEAASRYRVIKPKHLNALLEATRGEKTEKLVRYLVLRSLPQALYSATNEGHFGLASACYAHFTSPIRRYPDLVVHRILKEQLASPGGRLARDKKTQIESRLPEIARHASERERAAVEAERASVEIKKAQYMEQKIGEVYPGLINGVTNFGLFVELENTVEGMIPIADLGEEYFFYNEKAAALVGERTRKTYRLGDPIEVRVVRASREEGKVTFAPVS